MGVSRSRIMLSERKEISLKASQSTWSLKFPHKPTPHSQHETHDTITEVLIVIKTVAQHLVKLSAPYDKVDSVRINQDLFISLLMSLPCKQRDIILPISALASFVDLCYTAAVIPISCRAARNS